MNSCSCLLTIILPIAVLLSNLEYKVKADTRIYVIKENKDAEESGKALRNRRQSHPDATVARLRDNGAFTPINGPVAANANEQQNIPNSDLTNDDPPLEPGLLIDYLVPPQPNAQISNQNFQDPAANLLTSSDVLLVETTPSTPVDVRQFQQPTFSLPTLTASSNQNQILVPSSASNGNSAAQTSSPVSSNVQGITFQNSAPSLTAPTPALLSPSPTTQFSVSREAANQFLRNEIGTQLEQQSANDGKWDLGFEAGEILSPPQQDLSSSPNRNQGYETLNVKRPNAAFNNPVASATLTVASTNNRFNIIAPTSSQTADVFQKDDRQANVIWGSQKQFHGSPNAGQNYIPTTALPFLPTAATVSNSNRFPTSATAAQFSGPAGPQLHGFSPISGGSGGPAALQLIEQQPAFSSQFDSYLSQGTVSDYTLFPFRETFRRYQRIKRQTAESPDDENNEEDEEQGAIGNRRSGSSDNVKPIGPVYSFVKTDKDGHYKWSVRHPSRR